MAGGDASGASPDAGGEGVGRLSVVIAQVGKGWNCGTVARSMVQEVSVTLMIIQYYRELYSWVLPTPIGAEIRAAAFPSHSSPPVIR